MSVEHQNNGLIFALDYGELNRAGLQSVQEDTVPTIAKDWELRNLSPPKQEAIFWKQEKKLFKGGGELEFLKGNTQWKHINIRVLLVIEKYKLQLPYTMPI